MLELAAQRAMGDPSLEVLKARLDGVLCSLSWWLAASPWHWVGRDHEAHPVPITCYELIAPHQLRLPRAPSSLALSTSRDGAPTASLGNTFLCLTTVTVKSFFLMSKLNLP